MAKGVRACWCKLGLWVLLLALGAGLVGLAASPASATITEGDVSIFGFFESRESARWGEGSATGPGTPTALTPAAPGSIPVNQMIGLPGTPAGESGGSFDFEHWDLVQVRQLAELRTEYHLVKNYELFGHLDTLILRDAEVFALYRPWYDALGSIKDMGRAEPNRDWYPYDWRTIQQYYLRDDVHEYYVDLDFTDNFSARVGKQQIIWSEADALSGTEITNPSDLTYHWNNFESPEDLRKNLKMVKLNYILPDFLKTADNLLELVWIPADWEGDYIIANGSDPRSPWVSYAALGPNPGYNQMGQPFLLHTFADQGWHQLVPLLPNEPFFAQENVLTMSKYPSNSIRDNSEFALRYSTLLPVGDGLQMSFIYLYEARMDRLGLCTACGRPYGAIKGPLAIPGQGVVPPGVTLHHVPFHLVAPGIWFGPGIYDFGPPKIGSVLGTTRVLLSEDYKRHNFFGLVGTYYDKDITNVVYRYDMLWAPEVGVGTADPQTHSFALGTSSSAWTEFGRIILAADRPTYIPWLSKQHTFLTAQYVNTFYPDKPANSDYYLFNFGGKLRRDNNLFFLGATNWLMDAQITSTSLFMWDIDDAVGFLESTNVYRYSYNVLFGLNAIWYLGKSNRFTDPFLFSGDQRMNEIELTVTYEI